jgi:hypothetical protein
MVVVVCFVCIYKKHIKIIDHIYGGLLLLSFIFHLTEINLNYLGFRNLANWRECPIGEIPVVPYPEIWRCIHISPAGDVGGSPNFRICDTNRLGGYTYQWITLFLVFVPGRDRRIQNSRMWI